MFDVKLAVTEREAALVLTSLGNHALVFMGMSDDPYWVALGREMWDVYTRLDDEHGHAQDEVRGNLIQLQREADDNHDTNPIVVLDKKARGEIEPCGCSNTEHTATTM